jgi:hypothetical protein
MGKVRKRNKKTEGPYLDAACICEQLIEENDGAYSVIRWVNRLTFWESECQNDVVFHIPLILFIMFKAGNTIGKRELFLYQTNPCATSPGIF